MPLLTDSKKYREELLLRNVYGVNNPYNTPILESNPIIESLIPNYGSISTLAQSLLYRTPLSKIALQKLSNQLILRTAQESLDEIIPINSDLLNTLKGNTAKNFYRDDFRITKKERKIDFIERVTGFYFFETPFTNDDYRRVGTKEMDDKLFSTLGDVQKLYFERNTSDMNYFSNRNKLYSKLGTDTVFSWLEKRIDGFSGYYSDLVHIGTTADEVQSQQGNYTKNIDDPSPISKILTDPKKSEILRIEGEYGGNLSSYDKIGNCGINGNYQIFQTEDINDFQNTNDAGTTIIWGATTISDIENKFGAKRGLLRFTAEMTNMGNNQGKLLNQTQTCYNHINGEIVYKANPCRNWTKTASYGKIDTLIRKNGNNNPYSVNKDFVIPKIHPNGDNDTQNRYMFAIENLAWTKQDLIEQQIPECEWGNLGGRMMWFPPYIENVSENASAGWQDVNFVGRLEGMPIHNGTSKRTGTMSFFLIMDYPMFVDNEEAKFMANLMMCNEDEINLGGVTFGNGGGTSLTPAVVVADGVNGNPSGDSKPTAFPDGTNIANIPISNYYFENDEYRYELNYEYYADATKNDTKNLFSLNSDFFGNGTLNINPLATPTSESIFEKINTEIINKPNVGFPLVTNVPNRYLYKITFEGNASKLYIVGKTDPSTYNIYLSFRRVFTLAQQSALAFSTLPSNYKLIPKDSALNVDTQKILLSVLGKSSLNDITLADFDVDKMFPYKSSFQPSISIYSLNLDDKFYFQEITPSGTMGIAFYLIAKGSTQSNTGTQNINFNELIPKRERNVKISVDFIAKNAKTIQTTTQNITNSSQQPILQPTPQQTNPIGTTTTPNTVNNINLPSTTPPCSDRFIEKFKDTAYDMIADRYGFKKIKTFARAFHSQTPEDYHRRLTFLHQLLRMGKSNAVNGAENSSFGKAPMAILRVGDFFHTRVAINSIDFQHGSGDLIWDLNGEGMGVQPMWTKVTMNYTLIGGESLYGPVDRLQNAISFNYYANSTFYDTGIYSNSTKQQNDQIEIDNNRRNAINAK